MTKETVSTPLASKAKAKARAKETVTTAEHQGITQEIAPTRKKERAKAKDSKEIVTIAVRKATPQEIAPTHQKERAKAKDSKETVTKGKAKDGVGERASGKSTEKKPKEIGSGSRMKTDLGESTPLGKDGQISMKTATKRSEGRGPEHLGNTCRRFLP